MKWGPEARKKIADLEQLLARVEQERDQLRHVAELCSRLAADMIAWRQGPNYHGVPVAIDASVEKLEGVF